MRILIADDSTAGSKALRAHFPRPSRRGKAAGKAALAEGHLLVSCGPARAARGKKPKDDDCSCSGLDLGDQPEQATSILDALGIALLNRGCLEEGSELIELALKIRRKVFGNNHPLTALSLNSDSRVQRERGDYARAEVSVRDALRINRAVYGNKGLPVAVSLYELGVVQLQQGVYADAEQSAIEGLDILNTLGLAATDPNTTRLMDVRARAEAGLGRLSDAAATYNALLKLDQAQLGTKNHPKYATHLANYGLVLEAMRKLPQAASTYRNAIELYGRTLNRPCHPNLIDVYANLGSLLRTPPASKEKIAEAGVYLKKALELGLKVRGKSHALVGNDHSNFARWQYDTGSTVAAKGSFSTALGIYAEGVKKRGLPPDHTYIAEALTWKGRVLVETGSKKDAAEAEPLLRDAIAKWPVQSGPNSPGEGIARACLGRSLSIQEANADDACRELCEGFRIARATVTDKTLLKRFEDWIRQQGCDCAEPPSATSC